MVKPLKPKPSAPPPPPQIPQRALMPTGRGWWKVTDRSEAPKVYPLNMSLAEAAVHLTRQLNMRPEESDALQGQAGSGVTSAFLWAAKIYATDGALPALAEWPDAARKEARTALENLQFRMCDPAPKEVRTALEDLRIPAGARLCFGYFGPELEDPILQNAARNAYRWLTLGILATHEFPIRRCLGCKTFFVDAHHRGKMTCSAACGSKLRAHLRYERIKETPRKYRAYLKKQCAVMKKRRAAGLA
jgi:hypothetical protein